MARIAWLIAACAAGCASSPAPIEEGEALPRERPTSPAGLGPGAPGDVDGGSLQPTTDRRSAAADAGPLDGSPEEAKGDCPAVREIRFSWCPSSRVAEAYEMSDPEDRHRIVLTPGVAPGGRHPVVVGFHGQPRRGTPPREYWFTGHVEDVVVSMVEAGEIVPVVLVLPVFRFVGGNWPWMDPADLRREVESILEEEGILADEWLAFGHSGAAGCGGAGLNRAHRMSPAAVGFFDTCLGKGWAEELSRLREKGVRSLSVHSVETAGFRPRQRPEYQASFDFGRAYGPAGLKPVDCPPRYPGSRLRDQEYRCCATPDGLASGFVVDSGEGAEAHRAVLEPVLRYFLVEFAGLAPRPSEVSAE